MKKIIINKVIKIVIFLIIILVCGYFIKQAVSTFTSQIKTTKNSGFFVNDNPEIREMFNILSQKVEAQKATYLDYFKLATLYAKRKDWVRAEKFYLKTIELNPDLIKAYNNLGNVYFNLNKIDEAIFYYQKAGKLDSDYLNAYINLGLAYFKKGLIKKAVAQWDYVLEKDPNNQEVISYRQWIYQ